MVRLLNVIAMSVTTSRVYRCRNAYSSSCVAPNARSQHINPGLGAHPKS
jgi:hypothetical protein